MNCRSTLEMLTAYLDRELGPQERNAIRGHLADCERCRTEERDLRALKGLLLGVRAPEPAADFEHRLMTRLHAEAAAPARVRLAFPNLRPLAWSQFGGLAAAASLAVVVVVHAPAPASRPSPHPVHEVAMSHRADIEGYVNYMRAREFAGGTSMLNDAP